MPKRRGHRTDETKAAYRSSRGAGGSWDAIETRRTLRTGEESVFIYKYKYLYHYHMPVNLIFIIYKQPSVDETEMFLLTLSPFSPVVPGNPMGPLCP